MLVLMFKNSLTLLTSAISVFSFLAAFSKCSSWVWCNKVRKMTAFREKYEECWSCSADPQASFVFNRWRRKVSLFLLSTAPEHHAGNEAVLCSRHFRSCLSFIIHCGYKSVKWLLVANNGLPHQFSHTRTYSFTSLWPGVQFSGVGLKLLQRHTALEVQKNFDVA